MSTHGYSGFKRFFLGSVTDRVIRAGQTPVLVVCNLTTEAAVLLTLYVALASAHPRGIWETVSQQLCRK
jgi:Universal stress protein family